MHSAGVIPFKPPVGAQPAGALGAPATAHASGFALLDERDEWTEFSRSLEPSTEAGGALWESTVVFEGMHCAACAATISACDRAR